MLVVQRFRQSTHARDRDFGFLQQGDPLFTGEAPKARLNDVPQLWQTLFPESHRRVAWIVDKFCNANRVAEALPPPLIHDRDENITILQSIEPCHIVARPIADAYRQTLCQSARNRDPDRHPIGPPVCLLGQAEGWDSVSTAVL